MKIEKDVQYLSKIEKDVVQYLSILPPNLFVEMKILTPTFADITKENDL